MSVHRFLEHADTSARSRMLTLHRQANEESSHKHAADYMEINFPERKRGSRTLDFRFHPFRTLSWKNSGRLTQKGWEHMKKVVETCVFCLLPINTRGPASGPVSLSAWTAGPSANFQSSQKNTDFISLVFYKQIYFWIFLHILREKWWRWLISKKKKNRLPVIFLTDSDLAQKMMAEEFLTIDQVWSLIGSRAGLQPDEGVDSWD